MDLIEAIINDCKYTLKNNNPCEFCIDSLNQVINNTQKYGIKKAIE